MKYFSLYIISYYSINLIIISHYYIMLYIH